MLQMSMEMVARMIAGNRLLRVMIMVSLVLMVTTVITIAAAAVIMVIMMVTVMVLLGGGRSETTLITVTCHTMVTALRPPRNAGVFRCPGSGGVMATVVCFRSII